MPRDRPSFTASVVAAARAFYTNLPEPFNVAPDPLADRLVAPQFALPARLVRRLPGLGRWVHRGAGSAFAGWAQHIALRTRAIDDIARDEVKAGIRQVVILGSGLDTRALRMPELADLPVFEVDQASTHRYKAARLTQLGFPAHGVRRVAVDLEQQGLARALEEHGFRRGERSLWIWEGVTMYLEHATVARLLRDIGQEAASRSRLALTYLPPQPRAPAWFLRMARTVVAAAGEPFRSTIQNEDLHTLLGQASFRVVRDEGRAEWVSRYWPGERTEPVLERLCVAEKREAETEVGPRGR